MKMGVACATNMRPESDWPFAAQISAPGGWGEPRFALAEGDSENATGILPYGYSRCLGIRTRRHLTVEAELEPEEALPSILHYPDPSSATRANPTVGAL